MKSKVLAMVTVAVLMFAGSAFAQSDYVKADVPFAFQVNKVVLPAGSYSIERTSSPDVLLIAGDHKSVLLTTMGAEEVGGAPQTQLVFKKYGNSYFLYQVWRATDSNGFELPVHPGKALTASKAETVQVAAVARSK